MIKKKTTNAAILLTAAAMISSCTSASSEQPRIDRMAEFINTKYGIEVQPVPSEYGKENKEDHTDILGFGFSRDIPYYAVFPVEDGEIYVIERDGVLSDNGQLKGLNYMLGDYLTEVTGYEIEFVEIRTVSNGNTYDTKIAEFIQRDFGELITEDNIGLFFDGLCATPYTQLLIYAPECDNQEEMMSAVTEKLSVFAENETIKAINLYIYSGELKTERFDVKEKVTDDKGNVDYSHWDYIFDYYYVINPHENFSDKDSTDNNFIMRADMILDRGYTASGGAAENKYELNGWIIGEF